MRRITYILGAVVALGGVLVYIAQASGETGGEAAPIFGIKIPPGYRDWRVISVAHEAGSNNDLRAVFHWSEAKSGLLATIELGALALASISGLLWQRRWNWRWLAIVATLVIVVANLAATQVSGFAGLSCARLVAGAGSGILVALYFAFLPGTRSPDRIGSIATFAQVITQVGGYYASSWLLQRWGLSGLYVLIAIIATLLLPFVKWIPTGPGHSEESPPDRRKTPNGPLAIGFPESPDCLANAFFLLL
jgi:hypothetical protein